MKKKVCRNCKRIVEEEICPICKSNQFNSTWQGRISVLDSKSSVVSRKMGIASEGEYAIKSR